MTVSMLHYLFYVGILLPTLLTVVLFVVFILCWRRQTALKAVLTLPYDPHGAMRRRGVSRAPPPPPAFLRGQDNTAFDRAAVSPSTRSDIMSASVFRASPSGDLQLAVCLHTGNTGHQQTIQAQHLYDSDSGRHQTIHTQHLHCGEGPTSTLHHHIHSAGEAVMQLDTLRHLQQLCECRSAGVRGLAGTERPTDVTTGCVPQAVMTEPATLHTRPDSGLSEAVCQSPGVAAGRREGEAGESGEGDRPQSQASQSSHSTDSQDSGFRGCSSAPPMQQVTTHEPSTFLQRSRSLGKKRDVKVESDGQRMPASRLHADAHPTMQLSPAALLHNHHHHHLHNPRNHHPAHFLQSCGEKETTIGTREQNLAEVPDMTSDAMLRGSGRPLMTSSGLAHDKGGLPHRSDLLPHISGGLPISIVGAPLEFEYRRDVACSAPSLLCTPTQTLMHPHPPNHTHTITPTPVQTPIHIHPPNHTHTITPTPIQTPIHPHTPIHTHTITPTLIQTPIHPHPPNHTHTITPTPIQTPIHPHPPRHTRTPAPTLTKTSGRQQRDTGCSQSITFTDGSSSRDRGHGGACGVSVV